MLPHINSDDKNIPMDKKTREMFYRTFKKAWHDHYRAINFKAKNKDLKDNDLSHIDLCSLVDPESRIMGLGCH